MNNTHFFKLSSALTIVAIERDLCQTKQASLDRISCYFRVISSLLAHVKSCLVTECVNATSVHEGDAAVWDHSPASRGWFQLCHADIPQCHCFYRNDDNPRFDLCGWCLFVVVHLLRMSWEFVPDVFFIYYIIFSLYRRASSVSSFSPCPLFSSLLCSILLFTQCGS